MDTLGNIKRTFKSEEGQYLVYTAIALPIVILLLGLVVDGGVLFLAYRRATNTAALAAQAASHAVDAQHFQRTNQVRLEPMRALRIAQEYVALNSSGTVRISGVRVTPNAVVLETESRVPLIFFRLFGLREITVRARAVAVPRFGIESAGQ